MSRNISTRLTISGESEYRRAIQNCNSELSRLGASLRESTQQFRGNANSMDALNAKGKILAETLKQQQAKVSALEAAVKSARDTEKEYADRIEKSKEKIADLEKKQEDLNTSTTATNKEKKELNKELESERSNLAALEKNHDQVTRKVNDYEKQLSNAKVKVYELNDEIKNNDKHLAEAAKSADHCATSIDKFGKEAKEAGDSAKDFGKRGSDACEALATQIIASGVKEKLSAIKDILIDCYNSAETFEAGMKQTFTLLPDLTDEAKKQMSEDMFQFSNDMNVLTESSVPALYDAISAGVPETNVFSFLGTAQKAAVGGVTDLGTAVDGLTSTVNAYNSAEQDAAKTADEMFTAVKYGKTNFEELSQSLYNVVPVAASAGIQFGNVAAGMAVITAQGTPTSTAATQLRQMLVELTDSGSEVGKTFQNVAGRSFKQFIKEGGNLQDAVQLLEKHARSLGIGTDELFGSVQAGQAVLQLTGNATGKFTETLKAMESASGAVDKAYSEMTDSAEYKTKRLETSFKNLKTAIGESVLDGFSEIKGGLADLSEGAADFVKQNPELVKIIAALAAGLGTVAATATTYITATKAMTVVTGLFNTVMNATWGQIALVASAVAGLTLALAVLFKDDHGEKFKKVTESARGLETSLQNSETKLEETKESYEKAAGKAEIYANRLKALETEMASLKEQGEDVTAQQNEYRILVDQLNKSIPDLNLKIDEQTGLLEGGADALRDQVEAWKELQFQQAMEAQMQEVVNAYAEAALELSQNQLALNEAQAAGNAIQGEIISLYTQLSEVTGENVSALQSYSESEWEALAAQYAGNTAAEELIETLGELYTQQGENSAEQQLYQEAVDTGTASMKAAEEQIEGVRNAYTNLMTAQSSTQEQTRATAEEFVYSIDDVQALESELDALTAKYAEVYTSAYDSIDGQMKLFGDYAIDTSVNVGDIISSMNEQVEYMRSYAENIRTLSDWGINQGFLQTLSDGSVESATILAAIVAGGQENVQELNEKLGEVESGKEEFANTIAEMQTGFTAQMSSIEGRMQAMVREINQKSEAYNSSVATMEGAISGLRDKYYQYATWVSMINAQAARIASASYNGSHMAGLQRVPFDGYVAELHEGERVLTEAEARAIDFEETRQVVDFRIPNVGYEMGKTEQIRKEPAADQTNIIVAVAQTVKEMLKGAEIVLDDKAVGKFAIDAVTEDMYS